MSDRVWDLMLDAMHFEDRPRPETEEDDPYQEKDDDELFDYSDEDIDGTDWLED